MTPSLPPIDRCPLCHQPLPADATECTKCDWNRAYGESEFAFSPNRDLIATLLSIIPGVGHLYKGHAKMGGALLAGAMLCFFWSITFFMFFGFIIIPIYWLFVAVHAYLAEDLNIDKPSHFHLPT